MVESTRLDELRAYLESYILPNVLKWDRTGTFPEQAFQHFHEMGIISAGISKEYGGQQLEMEELLKITSVIAEYSPGIVSSLLGNLAAQTALDKFGGNGVCSLIFESQRKNKELMSFCATEMETGTDIGRLETEALITDKGYILSGNKNYITNINFASHLIVLAKVKSSSRDQSGELTAFYVPANSPGIRKFPALSKLGQNESNTAHIQFDRVRIPSSYRVGEVGQGVEILESCISRTKTLIAGTAVGICSGARSEAIAYLQATHRYGRPLIELPAIKSQLTRLQVDVEAAKALAVNAGKVWDSQGKAVRESSVAKFFAANIGMKYVETALELCGASGYMADHRLSKMFRDAKLLQIYEGASLVQLALIGKALFKRSQRVKTETKVDQKTKMKKVG